MQELKFDSQHPMLPQILPLWSCSPKTSSSTVLQDSAMELTLWPYCWERPQATWELSSQYISYSILCIYTLFNVYLLRLKRNKKYVFGDWRESTGDKVLAVQILDSILDTTYGP